VVIVPTNYYTTPTAHFEKLGVSTVIWANHNLRASVKAMQALTAQIYRDQSLVNIQDMVCMVPRLETNAIGLASFFKK
jgi:phosphoenolpyruvate phosphomutase